jgi:hypothetical protein
LLSFNFIRLVVEVLLLGIILYDGSIVPSLQELLSMAIFF